MESRLINYKTSIVFGYIFPKKVCNKCIRRHLLSLAIMESLVINRIRWTSIVVGYILPWKVM